MHELTTAIKAQPLIPRVKQELMTVTYAQLVPLVSSIVDSQREFDEQIKYYTDPLHRMLTDTKNFLMGKQSIVSLDVVVDNQMTHLRKYATALTQMEKQTHEQLESTQQYIDMLEKRLTGCDKLLQGAYSVVEEELTHPNKRELSQKTNEYGLALAAKERTSILKERAESLETLLSQCAYRSTLLRQESQEYLEYLCVTIRPLLTQGICSTNIAGIRQGITAMHRFVSQIENNVAKSTNYPQTPLENPEFIELSRDVQQEQLARLAEYERRV